MRAARSASVALVVLLLAAPLAAERLALRHVGLDLPGPPATVVDADLDGDGRRDLAVVVAYTGWEQVGIEEAPQMDPALGLVEVLTIVPALVDRRELHLFFATADGYRAAAPWPLATDVLSLLPGPPGAPLLALTDAGVAAVRPAPGGGALFEPLVATPPVLARSQTFVPGLDLVHDLDGDGRRDLLLPTADGFAVHLATADGLAAEPASRPRPAKERERRSTSAGVERRVRIPDVRDVTGDGLPELLFPDEDDGWGDVAVLRNLGGGRFAAAATPLADLEADGAVVHVGDLDGDGVGEVVTQEDLSDDDAGFRQSMAEAKVPPQCYRLRRTGDGLAPAATSYAAFDTLGHAFGGGDGELPISSGFQDLDGDRRLDLVTLGLDFSLVQAVRVMSTHRLTIEIDFFVWCQAADGGFRRVEGLDLSGKLKVDLDDLRFGRLSQFAGDFDGDGRADFVQMGRGRAVTIHLGGPGCRFPSRPDLTVRLAEEPADVSLVQVRDLDGDGRADLLVTQPRGAPEPGVTPPARLDLYLSGGAR